MANKFLFNLNPRYFGNTLHLLKNLSFSSQIGRLGYLTDESLAPCTLQGSAKGNRGKVFQALLALFLSYLNLTCTCKRFLYQTPDLPKMLVFAGLGTRHKPDEPSFWYSPRFHPHT